MSSPRFITAAEVQTDNTIQNDPDGKKAIDLTVPTFTGRTLYSSDGETKVMSWGNADAGIVTAQFGIAFDWPASINMVDPADFSPSSDTTEARAMLFANYVNLDALWLTPSASPPDNAQEGMLYADTDHTLKYYNGTDWKTVAFV